MFNNWLHWTLRSNSSKGTTGGDPRGRLRYRSLGHTPEHSPSSSPPSKWTLHTEPSHFLSHSLGWWVTLCRGTWTWKVDKDQNNSYLVLLTVAITLTQRCSSLSSTRPASWSIWHYYLISEIDPFKILIQPKSLFQRFYTFSIFICLSLDQFRLS